VLNLCAQEGIEPQGFIVIHPVSRWRFKTLAPRQIAEVISLLHQRGERIVLTGGPDPEEQTLIGQILAHTADIPLLNVAGRISLKELGAFIAQAKALICVDSVPLHIASAVKTPVVALFGPTSEINWGPWMHPRAAVVTSQHSCRPCYQDGCGGSKKSDCLLTLSPRRIVEELYFLIKSEVLVP